ncbi:hypothetical protein L7F22_048168 [Adiantum nelumboides]|nr:hypothetical protein [Adiantum nelumboides]
MFIDQISPSIVYDNVEDQRDNFYLRYRGGEFEDLNLGDGRERATAQPIPILPPPSLPDPPASPVITPSTSHPVPSIQPPDVSPDHALSDSDSDLDVADATPEVDAAPPRWEKRIPGWLYSTVASSGVTELPVPPPAGLPRRSARLRIGGRSARTTFLEDPTSLENHDKTLCPSVFDPAQKYLSLIIPAFNEEDRLPVYIEETLRYLQRRALTDKTFTYEIIVVDDGSSDKTVKVAFDYARRNTLDRVRVIKLGRNYGKGAAVRKGMLCARGELLLMLDADGATKITDLEKLETEIKEVAEQQSSARANRVGSLQGVGDSSVVVFGSRAHLEQKALATRKWYRNFLMKGFHFCVLLVAGKGVRDTQCGFKMFTRCAAQQLFVNLRLKRWCFDVELVYLCKKLHIPIQEVAVTWTEIPGSKVKPLSILHMLIELVLIRLGYGLQIWKIQRDFMMR